MNIYLDSAAVIYIVEDVTPYARIVDSRLSRDVVDLATGIRARYSFKVPDALHLATALWSNCEVFLTNDHRLDSFRELSIEVVQR